MAVNCSVLLLQRSEFVLYCIICNSVASIQQSSREAEITSSSNTGNQPSVMNTACCVSNAACFRSTLIFLWCER